MQRYLMVLLILSSSGMTVADEARVSSVEENLRLMDKDRNGLVTASEVRAYLQSRHGDDYEKSVLDKLQSTERGASCGTPFAQTFF
jgi:Ca2+-binding EF-hand superfamily protein